MIKTVCPGCENISTKVEPVEENITLIIRGHEIEVVDKYLKCHVCGETWSDPKSDYDFLEIAYAKAAELEAQ